MVSGFWIKLQPFQVLLHLHLALFSFPVLWRKAKRAIFKSLQRLLGHQESSQCKVFLMTYGESNRNHMGNISAEIHTGRKRFRGQKYISFFSPLPKKEHLRQLEICEKCLVLSLGWVLVSSCLLFPLNLPRACMWRRCQRIGVDLRKNFLSLDLGWFKMGPFAKDILMRQCDGSFLVFPLWWFDKHGICVVIDPSENLTI